MKKEELKRWSVEYAHEDGRAGVLECTTELAKSDRLDYGNGFHGCLKVVGDGYPNVYDLRYNKEDDLHMVMLRDYFGKGLLRATEI